MAVHHLSSLMVFLTATVAFDGIVSARKTNTTLPAARVTSLALGTKSDSVARGLAAMQTFLLPAVCPPPFEAWGGLCLSFGNDSRMWHEAEAHCISQDGHLVWMQSRIEHNVIRGFVLSKERAGYFWTGLYRPSNGSLSWSNGFHSSYRGKPFTEREQPFVSADSRDHQFDGDGDEMHLPFVCRRQSRSDGQKANLMMILEHNRMEIEDQVKVMGVIQMEKVKENIAKLAVAFNEAVVKCPPPWVRFHDMCLMYIFQLRTWPDAEDLCTVQGGTLFWYNNDEEMKLVQNLNWTPHKRVYKFYWIGLHKGLSGKLIWTGHSPAFKPISETHGKYVAVDRFTGELNYADDSSKFSAICRRLLSK